MLFYHKHVPELFSVINAKLLVFWKLASALPKDRASVTVDTLKQPDFYIFPLSGALRKKKNKWTSKPGSHEKSDAYTHPQLV